MTPNPQDELVPIGHVWDGRDVCRVYQDPAGRQFYTQPATKQPVPLASSRYLQDENWRDLGRWDSPNIHTARIAYHEAGHAALAILGGIGIEYITVEPFTDENGRPLNGLCRWPYDFPAQRQALEPGSTAESDWLERLARFFLGGIAADRRYSRECGVAVASWQEDGWSADRVCFARLFGGAADVAFIRVESYVTEAMEAGQVWAGVQRIATELTHLGAIPGRRAAQLFQG